MVESEGSPKDKEQIQEMKDKFEKQDKADNKTLEERLRDRIIKQYQTVMDA